MGYYADLIKQKQNAKPFYTLQGRELKTRSEVERYISDLEKEEREYFSYLRSYERKLEEAKNEPKPRSIGWADRISKYTDQIKSYKRSIERTDNWKSKAKEWLSQNRNSKEEKDNASVQDRFRYKGCMITILKKSENQYTFTIEQDGREEGSNATYPTQDKAESEAKREVEENWNEKEEGYYAKLAEEKAAKKNAEEKRTFKVMGEEFDISTIGGVKKAADAIERHFKRKRDELGLPSAEEWKAKIGHELLLASRQR